jgi:hypothetical protein
MRGPLRTKLRIVRVALALSAGLLLAVMPLASAPRLPPAGTPPSFTRPGELEALTAGERTGASESAILAIKAATSGLEREEASCVATRSTPRLIPITFPPPVAIHIPIEVPKELMGCLIPPAVSDHLVYVLLLELSESDGGPVAVGVSDVRR